jgi:CO/xanthine dehydrogenase Mo-binding subunit
MSFVVEINEKTHSVDVDGDTPLLWVLRDVLGMTGTKFGCDIQHDMYRPYFFDRLSAGLDEAGRPVAWNHRFAGSSIIARWLPPAFNNGLDPDTTDGAIDLPYAIPNVRVEYLRMEPPGIPTAFWRSVGASHNVFVVESFMDELAARAKKDPVEYRRALLARTTRIRSTSSRCVCPQVDWTRSQSGISFVISPGSSCLRKASSMCPKTRAACG